MRRSEYNLSRDIEPTQEALLLIERLFPQSFGKLIQWAASGSHTLNPYHNLKHELQHVYWSNACLINSVDGNHLHGEETLCLASLFHDHNHSGGKQNDVENIARAISFVQVHIPRLIEVAHFGTTSKWSVDGVISMIRPTLFSKETGFPMQPTNIWQKCMRDADLMSIYSNEGRNLLLGLFTEMGQPLYKMTDAAFDRAMAGNAAFLRGAEMFTSYGQMMKEDHLNDCLDEFYDRCKRYRKYSNEYSGGIVE